MKAKKKYYNSCEFLPLWNFFKINGGKQELKYLIVLTDRLEYSELEVSTEELHELQELWLKVFEEYNTLEKNSGVSNFVSERSKIIYYSAIYLQEQAMIRSLLYRTNVSYIRILRQRGYKLSNLSQIDYWNSLTVALKRVENHLSYIETLKAKITSVEGESKKDGNPFDSIMAWIASNDIYVEDSLTVARYIKIKEIIQQRIKAKKQEQQKESAYGR